MRSIVKPLNSPTGRLSGLCLVMLAALAPSLPAIAQSDCGLVEVAALPMSSAVDGGITIPATIDSHPITLLVATDSAASLLASDKAETLGLSRHKIRGTLFTLYGGVTPHEIGMAENLKLGKLSSPEWPFVLVPNRLMPNGVDGALGPDILHSYDVDMDFAAGRLRLLSQKHCEGKVVYWTKGAVAVVPMSLDEKWHINVPVKLDGVDMSAAIDTGTARSMLSEDYAADAFRTSLTAPAVAPRSFHTLDLEGVAVTNPEIALIADSVSGRHASQGTPPLIIGREILRRFHIYIAYGERRLYLTAADAH